LHEGFRGYLLIPSSCSPNDNLEEFPLDELGSRLASRVRGSGSIPRLLSSLHEVVSEQHDYSRCVLLYDVVQIFRSYYIDVRMDPADEVGVSADCSGVLEQSEIDHISREVNQAIREKIVVGYLARGKIDRALADAMSEAFQALVRDWVNANEQLSLFDYLSRYYLASKEDYEEHIRAKMEYLLKLAREEFRRRLEGNV
jgi:hypothetical protein